MASFALDLTHPAHGTRRVEFVTPRTLALLVDGKMSRGRVGGRTMGPEALSCQWWPQLPELQFHVSAEYGRMSPPPPRLPKLNGKQVAQGTLKDGDVIQWRDFRISVIELRPLREAERAMVDAARMDDAALQVYADWLETKGATRSAEWARLHLSIGEERAAPAAYVRAIDLRVERLEQTYRRLSERRYAYVAPAFGISIELTFDEADVVLDYPNLAVRV